MDTTSVSVEQSVQRDSIAANTYTYIPVVNLGDFGPWVGKLILEMPCIVRANDVNASTFNVYCERFETSGEILMRRERGAARELPSVGYVPVLAAYPSDATGKQTTIGTHVTLELPECRLPKPIEGNVLHSRCLDIRYRITQLETLPGEDGTEPVAGLVFSHAGEELCLALKGWHNARMSEAVDGVQLEYGYFEPDFTDEPAGFAGPFAPARKKPERAAVIIWLHGAGEGGNEVYRAYAGNRVTALSQKKIQDYFGGAAWVIAPQSPTFWMDDGVEQLGHSNQSIYTRALKALIDEFIAEHADRVDTSRIIIGGLSNGGFMTVRMCADYPGFFAASIPTCAPFFVENQDDATVAALATTPTWFVHSKGDELVDPTETSLPLYASLKAAGTDVHMTYFDHVEDLTGVYREADGSPKKTFNHGVWIHVYNDFCRTDLDGTNVMLNGEPVGAWEWAAQQRLA